jgi:hypothetical protein
LLILVQQHELLLLLLILLPFPCVSQPRRVELGDVLVAVGNQLVRGVGHGTAMAVLMAAIQQAQETSLQQDTDTDTEVCKNEID